MSLYLNKCFKINYKAWEIVLKIIFSNKFFFYVFIEKNHVLVGNKSYLQNIFSLK